MFLHQKVPGEWIFFYSNLSKRSAGFHQQSNSFFRLSAIHLWKFMPSRLRKHSSWPWGHKFSQIQYDKRKGILFHERNTSFKSFVILGNDRYLTTEFGLSLRIIEIVHLAEHARKRGTFFCSFGNILEVLYLYFILSGEMAWMPFLTASDMEVTLPWRVMMQINLMYR